MKNVHVSKAVIQKSGTFLLVKRSPQASRWSKAWDFVGGRLELGETPVDALAREVIEETSIHVTSQKEIGTSKYKNTQHDELIIFHLFDVSVNSIEIILSDEHTDFSWFTREELVNLELHPSVRLYLENYS